MASDAKLCRSVWMQAPSISARVHASSGSNTYTAAEVALDLWRYLDEDPVSLLKVLGWNDVIEEYVLVERKAFEPDNLKPE